MSTYSKNYSKMMDGYNKILATIDSVELEEEMLCIPTLISNWVGLIDKWCDEIYRDKSIHWIWNRKREASNFGNAGMGMFEILKQTYEDKSKMFVQEEYDGSFQPTRIKSMQEIAHDE